MAEHFIGQCDCGEEHDAVCGWCHQPVREGRFNQHRSTECAATVMDLREKAMRLGYELVRSGSQEGSDLNE